jgi:voltage-gated potassium channel
MSKPSNRLLIALIAILVLIVVGVLGYMVIERYTLMDALYMTVITLTTVGYGEVQPLTDAGRVFTMLLLILGVGTLAYGISNLVEYVMTGSVSGRLARRRMNNRIEGLTNHVIICGYGRVGRSAALSLQQNDRPALVIEKDELNASLAREEGSLVLVGDASRDDILREGGVERAAGMLVCAGDDTLNLFVVLSARALNPQLHIVARSIDPENESKMRLAGADRVVSPYRIGGRHMANIMIRPHVTDFFDVVTLENGQELWVEELLIREGSRLAGRTLGETDMRRKTGATVVALNRRATDSAIMPDASTLLEMGDEMIVMGTREQLSLLETWTRT